MPFQTDLTERAPREWLRSGRSRFNSERADILRRALDPFHQLRNLERMSKPSTKATKLSRPWKRQTSRHQRATKVIADKGNDRLSVRRGANTRFGDVE